MQRLFGVSFADFITAAKNNDLVTVQRYIAANQNNVVGLTH